MNVIFLDYDGPLFTFSDASYDALERRIKTLADICHSYNCKVVVSSAHKDKIDSETLEPLNDLNRNVLTLFKKYGIDFIGKTPEVGKKTGKFSYAESWKEYEIIRYLTTHPEVEHYCVIDDDTNNISASDLNMVRSHLVKVSPLEDDKTKEGLLPSHKEQVKEVLELDNDYKLRL